MVVACTTVDIVAVLADLYPATLRGVLTIVEWVGECEVLVCFCGVQDLAVHDLGVLLGDSW